MFSSVRMKTSSSTTFSVLLSLCTLVVVLCGTTTTSWALMEDTSSRLLFTAQITSPSQAAFVANWESIYSLDASRINITSFLPPTSSSSSGRVTFFISGDGRCSGAMMGGARAMKPAGGTGGTAVVEQRGMLPMSSFSIPSSMSIPASWLPTTTTAPTTAGPTTTKTTTTAATLPPTSTGSTSLGSFSMPSGMSMPSSAMMGSSGSLPSGSMPSSFSMGSMSMPSGSMPSMPSMSGMSSDPCFPTGPYDMGLIGWQDVQLMLLHQPVSYTHLTLPTKRIV
eukprot:TRINITY_DN3140_c0_g1_i4.p1 TRINITY_DN3140_c0_g1~~TRINITY_DN3140_c0_g1_i4.p1  ORF type:complete len:280 (-),score=39.09 TRINITY_DN3140_c0_g1_i4:139-978(-)